MASMSSCALRGGTAEAESVETRADGDARLAMS